MIPVVLGIIASSRQVGGLPPGVYQFTIYGDCNQTGGTIVYSDSSNPFPSGSIYTNTGLTVQYNGDFVYNNYNYNATSGSVTALAPCYRSWVTYADCNSYRDGGTPTTYYTAWVDSTLQNGVAVYTESTLTTSAGSITFTYSGMVYVLAGGTINNIATCFYSLLYNTSSCGAIDNLTFYTTSLATSNNALLGAGAILYADTGSTLLTNDTIYRYGYSTYITTNDFGVVNGEMSCPT